jgi:AraC-like DNA-binding protein
MNSIIAIELKPNRAMTNILVSHSNALICAGLVATMQRISGCEVRTRQSTDTDWHHQRPLQGIDLLVADSAALAQSVTAQQGAGGAHEVTAPQIVLLTAETEALAGPAPMPAGVTACLSMNCRQDDLLSTVCGLIGTCVPGQAEKEMPAGHPASPEARAPQRPTGGLAPSALRRVREHIEQGLAQHIELCDLAELTGLSPCHFSRAFKQSMGMPPHRYLMSRRVVEAARLIETTQMPMSEIALEVGFADQSHFTRVFTAQIGESPRRFRHQRR